MINAYQASYVIGSDVTVCCGPSTLCFAERIDAERFAAAFGGTAHDFAQAMDLLRAAHQHGH
jgi:nitrous oxide reductase accessory protein NosL